MATILTDRLAQITTLDANSHTPPDSLHADIFCCVMEAVAYVTGEPWSDHPQCADPLITNLCMGLNDGLDDDERDNLIPLIPRIAGSRGSHALEERRGVATLDFLAHEVMPPILRAADAKRAASLFETLPAWTGTWEQRVNVWEQTVAIARADLHDYRPENRWNLEERAEEGIAHPEQTGAWFAAYDVNRDRINRGHLAYDALDTLFILIGTLAGLSERGVRHVGGNAASILTAEGWFSEREGSNTVAQRWPLGERLLDTLLAMTDDDAPADPAHCEECGHPLHADGREGERFCQACEDEAAREEEEASQR